MKLIQSIRLSSVLNPSFTVGGSSSSDVFSFLAAAGMEYTVENLAN